MRAPASAATAVHQSRNFLLGFGPNSISFNSGNICNRKQREISILLLLTLQSWNSMTPQQKQCERFKLTLQWHGVNSICFRVGILQLTCSLRLTPF